MAISANCIRMGAVRLCLALVLGLLLVSGYVVAPVLFAKAVSHQEAGMLAGHIFHLAYIAALFLLIAVAAFWLRLSVGRLNWSLLLMLLILISLNEFVLSPLMQALKDSVVSVSALPSDAPIHAKFAMYHGFSAMCHLLATALIALLVALGGRARPAEKETHA